MRKSPRTVSRQRLQFSLRSRSSLLLSFLHLCIGLSLLLVSGLLCKAPLYLFGKWVAWDIQHGKHSRAAPIDLSPLRTSGMLTR